MLSRPALIAASLLGFLAAAAPNESAKSDKPRVVVLKSADLAAYAQVVAGFSSETRAQVEEVVLDETPEAQGKQLKALAEKKPGLILAIGPAAAVGARKQFSDVPVIFVMVPYYQRYELEGQNVTGVALTSDLALELDALKAMVSKVKKVGVPHDPRFSQAVIEAATALATERGLSLVPLEVDAQPGKLEKVLRGAKGRVDALIMISDRTVGNTAVVQRVLAWSSEEKVPAVGLTPGQVREGALLAMAPAATGIGAQAGRLANRVLFEKIDPGAMAVQSPEGVELYVNWNAAKKMASPADFATDVIGFAAKKGLALRVYE
jgi:putative tryptophan/tyrosine transport system substrate-binding protein